jgi:hypothetical protein
VKLVQTLVVRDDGDVVDAQIAFHLQAGVDFVVAASNGAALDVLDRYERDGKLRVLREEGSAEIRTRMARMAATEFGADWVINAEPGEFWWPRGESLKDVLAPIPPRYTIVQGLRRELLPDLKRRLPVEDSRAGSAGAMLRPVHRADPDVVVQGNGDVVLPRSVPLRAWYPLEVFRASADGHSGSEIVDDTRLHDALQTLKQGGSLAFRTPDVVDDAAYAVECAAVGEVDLPRLEQYVTELEERIGWLEQRFWPRVLRSASRLLHRRGT